MPQEVDGDGIVTSSNSENLVIFGIIGSFQFIHAQFTRIALIRCITILAIQYFKLDMEFEKTCDVIITLAGEKFW